MCCKDPFTKSFLSIPVSDHFLGFLGLIFSPETTLEKALNINDVLNFSSALSKQNPCPKNRENDQEWV